MTSTQGHPIFPVIQPKATQVHTYHRDGQMWFDDNGGASPVYEPNSFGGPKENPACKEPPLKISGNADHFDQPRTDTDFIQPGKLFKLMPADAQARLIENMGNSLVVVPKFIQERMLSHIRKADAKWGEKSG